MIPDFRKKETWFFLEGFTLIPSVNSNFEDEEKYRALVR
jgi:hypothetical protein